jgi:hypothetical protein
MLPHGSVTAPEEKSPASGFGDIDMITLLFGLGFFSAPKNLRNQGEGSILGIRKSPDYTFPLFPCQGDPEKGENLI